MRAQAVGTVVAAAMALAFAGGLSLGPRAIPESKPAVSTGGLACDRGARSLARLELLFGALRPDGRLISDDEWRAFLDAEVTPRFPDGLTVLSGDGQWRNGAGRITRERSRILLVWYAPNAGSERDISAIRDAYRKQFSQESVMRVDGVGCVSF